MPVSFQVTAGIFRFGPDHHDWRNGDPALGKCDWHFDQHDYRRCQMFGLGAKQMSIAEHRGMLRLARQPFLAIADWEFERMQEVWNGVSLETDLTKEPFRRREIA